jgi:hypothetical protein
MIAQRQQQTENLLNSLKLHEAWDILDSLKKMVCDESQSQKVRNLLENCPQLIPAIYEIEVSSILLLLSLPFFSVLFLVSLYFFLFLFSLLFLLFH